VPCASARHWWLIERRAVWMAELASYLEEREIEAGVIPTSATREAELVAKSTLPVPPHEPADERVAPLRHETSLSLGKGDATQRVHIAATVVERVAVFEAVEASHLALRLSHRP
jgi:hypothetical protein